MSERDRLHRLYSYEILDSTPEAPFDRLVALAAELFDAPIALITFLDEDRQWFKARHGVAAAAAPRAGSLCEWAIDAAPGEVRVDCAADADPRARDNALVAAGACFYAGAVLTSPDGHNVGTLCILDERTRPPLTRAETIRLRALAELAMDSLELRRMTRRAAETQRALELVERLAIAGRQATTPEPLSPAETDQRLRAAG